MGADFRQLVRQGYEQGDYADEFRERTSLTAFERGLFERLTADLPAGGRVLDLGCGTGVPYDRYLVDLGYAVTGVDFAANHIGRARKKVPEATYLHADIADVEPSSDSFDGLVCLYTLFHLPSDEHPALLDKMADHLRPGGSLLLTLGTEPGESVDRDWCGAEMAWTSLAPSTYRRLLAETGFEIRYDTHEGEPGADEHHWWVLATYEG